MKQWKLILSGALVVSGLFFYQKDIFSANNTLKNFTLDVTSGDAAPIENLALSFNDMGNTSFYYLNGKAHSSRESGPFKRADLDLTGGDPDLITILDKNPGFFRGTQGDACMVTDQYAIIFYTTYDSQTATLMSNIYNKETNEVKSLPLSSAANVFREIYNVYIEGDTAYLLFCSSEFSNQQTHEQFIIEPLNLKTFEKGEAITFEFPNYVYPEWFGSIRQQNNPFVILKAGWNDENNKVNIVDGRTGEVLITETHDAESSDCCYLRDAQSIYRFNFSGTPENTHIEVDVAHLSEGQTSFEKQVTLEEAPFSYVQQGPMVPVTYDTSYSENGEQQQQLADKFFSAYSSYIDNGILYLFPTHLDPAEKEGLNGYIFDLSSGKLLTTTRLTLETRNIDIQYMLTQLKKVTLVTP
ncbi:hypothetical protein [Allofustis seminis]|uniref:hypothetical protein n=1 Tax=Allofustis seminis TaxID=166939 RepID=UPI00035E59A5|nr:hypothetical protein [Allofustis seminis]